MKSRPSTLREQRIFPWTPYEYSVGRLKRPLLGVRNYSAAGQPDRQVWRRHLRLHTNLSTFDFIADFESRTDGDPSENDTIRLDSDIFTALSPTGLTPEQYTENPTGTAGDQFDRIIYNTTTASF